MKEGERDVQANSSQIAVGIKGKKAGRRAAPLRWSQELQEVTCLWVREDGRERE